MYRIVLFDDDNANDDEIIAMQRRPKIFYERINYLEFYDDHDFINRFRLSKGIFNTILRSIENEISSPSTRYVDFIPDRHFVFFHLSNIYFFVSGTEQYYHQVNYM